MNEKYIQALRDAIRRTHGCGSRYIKTVPVKDTFEGGTAWEGAIEVFDLAGHPTARQCYAWGYHDDDGMWQYVAVLHVPPIDTPQKAVQTHITSQQKKG